MRNTPQPHQTAVLHNLRRLFWLRGAMAAFLASVVLLLHILSIPLPLLPVGIALGGMLLLNGITWLRIRHAGHLGEGEILLQLLADLAALSVLFYFTGGYSNPFAWMYLLPVAVAAVALKSAHAWLVALLAMACYSLLAFFHVPLSHLHLHAMAGVGLDIHLVGMWLGFLVSACLVAVFVTRIGQSLREYDRLVADAREKALESERMLALGTLAAAAAHELGTPLATIAVTAGEMADALQGQPQLAGSLALIRAQVGRCKEILTSITAAAGSERAGDGQPLDAFLDQTIARWRDLRPATSVDCSLAGSVPAPTIVSDRTLGQALTNLLDNAADAAATRLVVNGAWDAAELRLDIVDDGPGLAPEVAAQAGTLFFTTKQEHGMGLGLYLARTILGRLGGSVTLENHPGGGAITRVRLPLRRLSLEARA